MKEKRNNMMKREKIKNGVVEMCRVRNLKEKEEWTQRTDKDNVVKGVVSNNTRMRSTSRKTGGKIFQELRVKILRGKTQQRTS